MAETLTILMIEIALEGRNLPRTDLVDQESRDRTWDFDIGARNDAEKPRRSQHEREAEAVVITPQPIDDLPVASVQMEIPRQLIRRRSGSKIAMALSLLIGQVAGWHIVRNLRLLRRQEGSQKTQCIFFAKYLCGSGHFSNMFCNALGVLA